MRNRFLLALAFPFFFAMGMRGQMVPGAWPTPDVDPTGNTGALKAQVETGGSYDSHSGNATRSVTDLHVPGALGVYGLDFTRHWNSVRNDHDNPYVVWPTDFGSSGWSHSWAWNAVYAEDNEQGYDGGELLYITSITITFPDGHANKYKITRSDVAHPPASADPRFGPPYTAGELSWPAPGLGIHDRLCDMEPTTGSNFWLYLADGGAVHFVHGAGGYQATAVFDPHGLRTDLTYDTTSGLLNRVQQEVGGRWLNIMWGNYSGVAAPVIVRVETGGSAGLQYVEYRYGRLLIQNVTFLTLIRVDYPNDLGPGQIVSAHYTYGACYGDDPCSPGPQSTFPLLKVANDPHFAGAMTNIRYNYRGVACLPSQCPGNPSGEPYPNARFDYFYAQPESIAAEKSGETGNLVSGFSILCCGGTRRETNGLGAWRDFYYGHSAGEQGGYHCLGYELAKLTDFYTGPPDGVPFERQNYLSGQPRQVWDGRGLLTELVGQLSYSPGQPQDDSGQPAKVIYLDGSTHLYDRVHPGTSDPQDFTVVPNRFNHWLFSQTDERVQTTTYTRDARRRVKRIDYQGGTYETFDYDTNGFNKVTSHRLASGATITYEYDSHGLLQREYNSGEWDDRKEYTYDDLERVSTVSDGRSRAAGVNFSTRMTYNGRHQVVTMQYAGMINGVTYGYDDHGNCISITDELGHPSTYIYDSYRRCTSYTEPLNVPGWDCGATVASRTWEWVYDRVVNGNTIPASAHTSPKWRLQIEPPYNATGDRRVAVRQYDYNDRLSFEFAGMIKRGNSWVMPTDGGATHSYIYDQNGQKSSYNDPRNRVTNYTYDNRNRLITNTETSTTPPRITSIDYDVTGNKIKVTFPDAKIQQWLDYDAFGQAWRFLDELNNTTNLTYCWGPMRKLYTVTTHRGTENQLTTFSYDPMGRPTQTLFPDGSDEFSTYEFGQLKTWKTRRNQAKTIFYDARGREWYHTWNDGTPGITRTWDDANRLLTLVNSVSTIDYSCDDAGQVRTEGTTVAGSDGSTPMGGGVRKQVSYCRYPSGEVSRVTYPNGSTTVQRNYTDRGQLQGVGWTGGSSLSYIYFPDGKVDQQFYTNGVQTKFEYDERGMIRSVSHKNATGQNLAYREYWRDNRDRILAWRRGTDNSQNGIEDGRGDRYVYDYEGQLTSAVYRAVTPEATPTDPRRSDSFVYDELGTRVGWNTIASRGAMNFTRRDNNGLNQYYSWENNYSGGNPGHWGSSIYYDDNFGPPWVPFGNGVTMADGWLVASFNALNQPVAMWSLAYPGAPSAQYLWFGYDPLGRCVKRWMGSDTGGAAASNPATYFYYDGWSLVQEGSSANNAARLYVHGGRVDEIVASQAGGQWAFHHYDARGHCMLLTDTSANIMEQYDYDAFGLPYCYTGSGAPINVNGRPGSPWGNRFLFTGREYLSDLRVYDFRNRVYQPELGRFLQPDPKGFGAGDYNLYRYCHNDPVNKSDPTGLDTYQQNRELGGDEVRSNYNPFTHSFTFTTNPDNSIKNTYSWGNTANPRGWNLNQPEDIKAAKDAIESGKSNRVGDSKLDPYVDKAFGQLNKKENEHQNPPTCKYEAVKLLNTAKELQKADAKSKDPEPPRNAPKEIKHDISY